MEELVMSAAKPARKVAEARARPMIVRNWKCQPYESLMGFGKSVRNLKE